MRKKMGFAVEMFFDEKSEENLFQLQHALKSHGLPSLMLEEGGRPHLSLGVYAELDTERADVLLKEFCARERRFKVFLGFLGTFISKENVIFTAPVMNDSLRTMHLRFHQAFKEFAKAAWPHYLPGNWQPHCTLAIDLADEDFVSVFSAIKEDFQPREATVASIGLVAFRPIELLSAYPLLT
jgi:2'-5' RNA ligase